MKRFDKVPRDMLLPGQVMHVMATHTALRWAVVSKAGEDYEIARFDLRSNVESVITVPSIHLAASMAKRFVKEAA